jgi:hypothetical protein
MFIPIACFPVRTRLPPIKNDLDPRFVRHQAMQIKQRLTTLSGPYPRAFATASCDRAQHKEARRPTASKSAERSPGRAKLK